MDALSVAHRDRTLIHRLDCLVASGEVLGILGANGTGKTTLLMMLSGLLVPTQGQVLLDDDAVHSLPPLPRAQQVGLLPQSDEGRFFGTVVDYIGLGAYPCGNAQPELAQHLAAWDLQSLARRAVETLSGGERQRARLAQLSVQSPRHYLLDEPLTHLDPAHQARLLDWMRAEAKLGKSVIFTLHDPNWAAWHCDRLLFLFGDGRWQLDTPAVLLRPDSLEALYGPGTSALWQYVNTLRPG